MNTPKTPIWKKSIIEDLNLAEIMSYLWEVGDNGDMYGYDIEGESEYYYEYKDLFDDLSGGAYALAEAIEDRAQYVDEDIFNDVIVSSLGELYRTRGYDSEEYDYFQILNEFESNLAQEEARERLMKMTKKNLIEVFCKSIKLLALFWDIKTAHDCLTAIVDLYKNFIVFCNGFEKKAIISTTAPFGVALRKETELTEIIFNTLKKLKESDDTP